MTQRYQLGGATSFSSMSLRNLAASRTGDVANAATASARGTKVRRRIEISRGARSATGSG
jgi:hypothetical protein